jgi:hypothetical protein
MERGAFPALYAAPRVPDTLGASHGPWTLAYLAGHRDMSITKRYIHSQENSTRAAIEKARNAQSGHTASSPAVPNFVNPPVSG